MSTNTAPLLLDLSPPIPLLATLIREYAAELTLDLSFQSFDQELTGLPGRYAPPEGCALVAYWRGEPAGCGAFRSLGEGICEMKRLYVRPAFRGQSLGRRMAEALLDEARSRGYRAMRLDTLASMSSALALYGSLGFQPIAPYYQNPIPGCIFLEAPLSPLPLTQLTR